ncbi:ATP-binding cassette domain-containing protein [Fulvimarina endophytica]|uniref:ATP-binding cassette domain-containing protein n=1 Tax=Fulvimarina endophytica TaxID=2293836 RepID=A0A371X2Q9_9HYPH|nr:ATP-binding cassette domain-containing protein [Fulvimarina endophytica]RFC63508.1 ATP-binding cassette domain-containing protein [Fulvimarina endophytica]
MSPRKKPAGSPPPADLFAIEALHHRVDGRVVLDVPQLRLRTGDVTGLIGPNGSGKSTMVRFIARQALPDTGRILFDGCKIAEFKGRDLARRLAYLPQTPPTTDGMTTRELVGLGRYPWHGALGRPGPADRAAIDRAIALTETGDFANRPVDHLSGGERQRVWLAMLIAQEARCLVLDEPTSALDVAHQAAMLHLVRRLSHELGLSVIIVLHDINMAARICDRLVALRGGRIVADGPADAIMQSETLQAIYGIPMGILRQPETGAPIGYVA